MLVSAHEILVVLAGACPWCGSEDRDDECPEPDGQEPIDTDRWKGAQRTM